MLQKDAKNSRFLLSSVKLIAPRFNRPIFIISAPRSGSTHFYECVRRMKDVFSFGQENSPMWTRIFPVQETQSDYINPSQCNEQAINAIKSFITVKGFSHGFGLEDSDARSTDLKIAWKHSFLRKPIRYMEKTITNCFHIDALEKIFPDALYIHLIRDGRANISSMLEGWDVYVKVGTGISLPENSTISHWSYAMPPGWKNWVDKSIEEICAWNWIECNQYILERYEKDPSFQPKYMQIAFEDFLNNPVEIIEKVSTFCQLELTEDGLQYVQKKPLSRSTISPPKKDKWKLKNKEKIERILPMISPLMSKLNYKC